MKKDNFSFRIRVNSGRLLIVGLADHFDAGKAYISFLHSIGTHHYERWLQIIDM